ncbi:unnamed protein product, partial [Allacma fusca]
VHEDGSRCMVTSMPVQLLMYVIQLAAKKCAIRFGLEPRQGKFISKGNEAT